MFSCSYYVINRGYYIRGFKTLFNRSPNMDSLIALGSSAAFIYSLYATFMMVLLSRKNGYGYDPSLYDATLL